MRGACPRWRKATATLAVLGALALGSAAAEAGRTPFGWVHATEVIPERTVELETWILEENGVGDDDEFDITPDETSVWWWTVVGLTETLELGVPVQIRHVQFNEETGATALAGFGAELRWRLAPPDPVEAGPLVPNLRLGVQRLVSERTRTRGNAGFALGIDLGTRVHVGLDIGGTWTVGGGESIVELAPAAGVSIRLWGELRAGAEVYGETAFGSDQDQDWLAAGPNVAWTHGRFWFSAAVPIGLMNIRSAPRINWAVAF